MELKDYYQGTSVAAPPDWSGKAGAAWRVHLAPVGMRGRPDWDGTVDMVLLRVDGAHPLWNHWIASVIHLRPIDGVKSATIRVPNATHELVIAALDPTEALPGLNASVAGWKPRYLRPIDIVDQFAAANDAVAAAIFELAVRAMVNGEASPDQDWRPWWSQALAQTSAHYAAGAHVVRPS